MAAQQVAAARQSLILADGLRRLGRFEDSAGLTRAAAVASATALVDDPVLADAGQLLSMALYHLGLLPAAGRAARRPDPRPRPPGQSVVIAILDRPAHGDYGIDFLLDDLAGFSGEVIAVFNNPDIGRAMAGHPRIDKSAILSANAGVARAWNIGLNLAQGEIAFVLNADLRVDCHTLNQLAQALRQYPNAGIAGIGGERVDHQTLMPTQAFVPGGFSSVADVDKVTGYLFALHLGRCWDAGIHIDPRLSPYFFEELDMAAKCQAAGLCAIAVPLDPVGWSHEGGISLRDQPIKMFGQPVDRTRVLSENAARVFRRFHSVRR